MAGADPQCGCGQAMRQSAWGVIDSIIVRRETEIRRLKALKEALPEPLPKDVEELLWQMLTCYKPV